MSMKKGILATVCTLVLVASMSMTATAATLSPTALRLIAPNIDIDFESEEADIVVAEISKPLAEDKPASAQLKIAVLEAVQNTIVKEMIETRGEEALEDFRFLGLIMINGKQPLLTEDYNVKFDVKALRKEDNVKVFAYNTKTMLWEKLPASSADKAAYVQSNNVYSAMFFIVDGVVAETTSEEIGELIAADVDETTSLDFSTDTYTAPITGETDVVMYLAFAAIAFAGIFCVSGKKFLAKN